MSAHVVVRLSAQTGPIGTVVVVDDRRWLVMADATGGKKPIPKLRVLAASAGAGAQPGVEPAHLREGGAAERHVGAAADPPHWHATVPARREELCIVLDRPKPLPEPAEIPFEGDLCIRLEFRRQD